jgi:hypothetical protein
LERKGNVRMAVYMKILLMSIYYLGWNQATEEKLREILKRKD